jgi:hypothetical protein
MLGLRLAMEHLAAGEFSMKAETPPDAAAAVSRGPHRLGKPSF